MPKCVEAMAYVASTVPTLQAATAPCVHFPHVICITAAGTGRYCNLVDNVVYCTFIMCISESVTS